MKISLVIPIKNEENSFAAIYESIMRQTLLPDEVILVDGGSSDKTIEIVEETIINQSNFNFIKVIEASPGRGRNIGTAKVLNEWVAYTDAGIKLSDDWLEKLAEKATQDPSIDIIYGNYMPIISSYFEMIATLAYVSPQLPEAIRGKSIASYLMKKKVWSAVGGFPDQRAAEDLMFMEEAEGMGFKYAFAPNALAYWQLRPSLWSTFRKFIVYSKHNVWADRQWDWHYGVLKQYLVLIPFLLLIFFYIWPLGVVLLWLFGRTIKRILPHRHQFKLLRLFNPVIFLGTAVLIIVIDAATFIGWVQAILQKKG